MAINWDEIPASGGGTGGPFISWGPKPGQIILGEVLDATPGTDYDGNPCAQISVLLDEPTTSEPKQGETRTFAKGDTVTVKGASPSSLKKGMLDAAPVAGDTIRIAFDSMYDTAKGGKASGKGFTVKISKSVAAGVGPVVTTDAPF